MTEASGGARKDCDIGRTQCKGWWSSSNQKLSPQEPLKKPISTTVFKYTWDVPKFVTNKILIPYLLDDML